jgi:pyrroline-5-carboxylate reductase
MKITIIGGGNIALAIISAITRSGLTDLKNITISEPIENRRTYLAREFGVTTTTNNTISIRNAEIVILAIKPQILPEVIADLNGKLNRDQLVISVVAGKKIENLVEGLTHNRVIRAMPNTPAQIGKGMTVWKATKEVSTDQLSQVSTILQAMGQELQVHDETVLDMATAISGSGPAYVFLFIESIIEAAQELGLTQEKANELVFQTVIGSSEFAQHSKSNLAELRRSVTSPGGTTASALAILDEAGFKDIIKKAIHAAFQRSQELRN